MLNASVPAELYWNSWRQTGWHRQKMTSRQEPTNKKGFSVERQTKNSTFVTRDATIIGPQMSKYVTFGKRRARTKKRMMSEAIMPVLIPAE